MRSLRHQLLSSLALLASLAAVAPARAGNWVLEVNGGPSATLEAETSGTTAVAIPWANSVWPPVQLSGTNASVSFSNGAYAYIFQGDSSARATTGFFGQYVFKWKPDYLGEPVSVPSTGLGVRVVRSTTYGTAAVADPNASSSASVSSRSDSVVPNNNEVGATASSTYSVWEWRDYDNELLMSIPSHYSQQKIWGRLNNDQHLGWALSAGLETKIETTHYTAAYIERYGYTQFGDGGFGDALGTAIESSVSASGPNRRDGSALYNSFWLVQKTP
jgi:hypothetical protein